MQGGGLVGSRCVASHVLPWHWKRLVVLALRLGVLALTLGALACMPDEPSHIYAAWGLGPVAVVQPSMLSTHTRCTYIRCRASAGLTFKARC